MTHALATSQPTSFPAPSTIITSLGTHSAEPLVSAAQRLLAHLSRGEALTHDRLKQALDGSFGGRDAEGAWQWKDAYEAIEVAQVLFLRRYLPSMRAKAKTSADVLTMLARVGTLLPTHTRRSEDSVALQQFSTPLEYAFIAAEAADFRATDLVLEPSAGTGQLAIWAAAARAELTLNEYAPARAALLRELFPSAPVTSFDAGNIHDYLDATYQPSVVLMNPPFSAAPGMNRTFSGVDLAHLQSALQRLAPGGRLVAITSEGLKPSNPAYADAFAELAKSATVRLTTPVAGSLFKRHGTTIDTRLTVIDKVVTDLDPAEYKSPCVRPETLLDLVHAGLPPRAACTPVAATPPRSLISSTSRTVMVTAPALATTPIATLPYEVIEHPVPAAAVGETLYQAYAPERIRIPGAKSHPTKLVQSAAMASVVPPIPTYQPHVPADLVSNSVLSDAQLESIIYAGEAHSKKLTGHWLINNDHTKLMAAAADEPLAVQFRRGWFLGDGTGAGKGRQVAGIILDNWLKGRRKALWVSKSDTLLEDAQRDWTALGQEKLLIVPQSRFQQGKPIALSQGILFTTYATLRSAEREGKASRLQQVLDWLGKDFDGVIVFDETHAMANAAGSTGERGATKPSQQGLAGLKLQHALPDARVLYVSATSATHVENLAYAQRLGLWGSGDVPFETREAFVAAMQQGGIASAEVLARDLKAMGLYLCRSLSYDGVEVEFLEHALSPEQVAIYDAYAKAYQIIHRNLEAALEATKITGLNGATLNRNAKSAARSAFEGSKQRFFNHLITAMKVPSLIRAIDADLAAGHAAVVQLVSTAEALMERRLADVPPADWQDLTFDVTPREYVLDYLKHSFPTQLFRTETDEKGNVTSVPVYVDGQPVLCRAAVAARDALLEQLASLPPVQAALDQLIHHYGTEVVAEVTGRSRRIVTRKVGQEVRLAVENRSGSANLAETQAFMDDKKRILVFSDAGGTGRSYHADLAALNQRPRVHYLLEAGWKADAAIQGLGRTNRTNQAHPPLFRPVATNIRGERRFLSTIARRLDSLGAITRGQRQTGGQGLFRASDNLESSYARSALRQFYSHLYHGKVAHLSLQAFEHVTGLHLTDADGTLREELPPITTFLNRVLALEIEVQNRLFTHFEGLLEALIESAVTAGTYDVGLETISADSLNVTGRMVVATHAATGAETELITVARRTRSKPISSDDILLKALQTESRLLRNAKSGRAALQVPAPSHTLDDGSVAARVRLIRPMEQMSLYLDDLPETAWEPCDSDAFLGAWAQELASIPEFQTTIFHVMIGLLLPIWKKLPADHPRVYRFTCDDGQAFLGRVIPADVVGQFAPLAAALSASEVLAIISAGRRVDLEGGLALKRVQAMGRERFEIIGASYHQLGALKALGAFSEIIAWKTRLFVPTGADALPTLTGLLEKYPTLAGGLHETQ